MTPLHIKPQSIQRDDSMSESAAALYTASSVEQLQQLRALGQGPVHLIVGNGIVRYTPAALGAWLRAKSEAST